MNILHRVSQADVLSALSNEAELEAPNLVFDLAVSGNWSGTGRIDFGTPHGSSTGPFSEIFAFSFSAVSDFGTAEFGAIDLAFVYWNINPSGELESFSLLTNPVDGFLLSLQLGENAAKLEGKKFATLEVGTLAQAAHHPVAMEEEEVPPAHWPEGPWPRKV